MANFAPTEVVPFWGFAGGETGEAASWMAGWRLLRQRLIYSGTFQARNVMRGVNSTLFPRSGLTDVTPTGLPNSPIAGFAYVPVPGKSGLAIMKTSGAVYNFDLEVTGSTATLIGFVGPAPLGGQLPIAVDSAGFVYTTTPGPGGSCYVIDVNGGSVGTITGSPSGTCICIHNESLGSRLVVGNISGTNAGGVAGPNLIYASTLNDFTNWKTAPQVGADPNFPANAITVGDKWQVNALFSQRTHLTVAKQESWWVITGGLNSFTARPVVRGTPRWPQQFRAAGMDGDGNIWFVPFFDDIPAVFDGAKFGETRTLKFNAGGYSQTANPPPFSVHRNMRHDEVFMGAVTSPPGAMNVALRQEGAWSFHQFNVPGGFAGAWTAPGSAGRIHMSDGGASAAPRFYTWRSHLDNRVPLSTGPVGEFNTDAGVTFSATVTLPEYWGRVGEVLAVRSVIVDFARWNTGFAAHNHYDLTVTNLRQYTDQAATPYAQPVARTASFDETTGSVPGGVGSSQTIRLQHNLDYEMGNGFQVAFSNMQGVAIHKVQVLVEVVSPTPRAA